MFLCSVRAAWASVPADCAHRVNPVSAGGKPLTEDNSDRAIRGGINGGGFIPHHFFLMFFFLVTFSTNCLAFYETSNKLARTYI
jgi:hypothetical protein